MEIALPIQVPIRGGAVASTAGSAVCIDGREGTRSGAVRMALLQKTCPWAFRSVETSHKSADVCRVLGIRPISSPDHALSEPRFQHRNVTFRVSPPLPIASQKALSLRVSIQRVEKGGEEPRSRSTEVIFFRSQMSQLYKTASGHYGGAKLFPKSPHSSVSVRTPGL